MAGKNSRSWLLRHGQHLPIGLSNWIFQRLVNRLKDFVKKERNKEREGMNQEPRKVAKRGRRSRDVPNPIAKVFLTRPKRATFISGSSSAASFFFFGGIVKYYSFDGTVG